MATLHIEHPLWRALRRRGSSNPLTRHLDLKLQAPRWARG